MINKDILIEDLVNQYPESVTFLMEKGVRCLACGEPVWGTLELAALEKGYSKDDIEPLVNDLNQYIIQRRKRK
jgi:methionine synthase II (cobalamin-independent)